MKIRGLQRTFIYHSPQYPGYTCWCGLWNMPDDSVMCSFHQATGPIEGRPKAPAEVRTRLSWPPLWHPHGEAYDMTGLDFRNVHLRSSDFGVTWNTVGSEHFQTCMNGVTCEPEEAMPDGAILRGVWGPYLPYDDVPRTGYMQRSTDGAISWGEPEVIYNNDEFMFWPKRIRVLRDGRVLTGGGLYRKKRLEYTRDDWNKDMTPVFFVSDDDGASWKGPLPVCPEQQQREFSGEELDWAELDNGDLLVIIRAETLPGGFDTKDPGQDRRQTRVVKRGATWEPTQVTRVGLPHSGHPELLAAREGAVLHLATTGISWTLDAGAHWTDFEIPAPSNKQGWTYPAAAYYPRAIQMANGEILCVGHVGGDDGYGVVDQSIVGLRFFLEE